ncbi:hypothetical protein MUS1_10335 [Marinomonas ushuaiensis DSM 15871]|uniref:Uncharacterized protein n=1 Tax=Marinomonas ushuaiensis DSM 15871 TaxID=1122207 RepID=X7E075_9GAMM|nr:hypothetical protein [Marinomonas ushuaiensis]ETX09367.1 hypothetical protein MUS1_10335 [Marinomonas ushuaiensis DSM 15871]
MDLVEIISTSAIVTAVINVIGVFWIKERLKQSIKHEYDQDLAKLKSELEFDLDKQKKLYEGKLSIYKKYYTLMDSYTAKSRKALFDGFQTGIIDVLNDPSDGNTADYIRNMLALQGDVSEIFLTFKNEINGLRLEAGEKLLQLLDEYVVSLEITQEKTVEFLQWMNENATKFITDPEETNRISQEYMATEVNGEGKKLIDLQNKIFLEMRNELGIV